MWDLFVNFRTVMKVLGINRHKFYEISLLKFKN